MHIPEEAIEAAARADWASYTEARGKEAFGDYPTFDSLPAYIQDKYRDDVRPMIEAAAPLLAPRPVTTMDEIYALTGGTILFDANEQCSIKWFNERGETYLLGTGDDYRYSPADIELPARVLYAPIDGAEEE